MRANVLGTTYAIASLFSGSADPDAGTERAMLERMDQLTMLGGLHGEKFRPYAAGDVVVSRGVAYIVESTTDAYARPALVCIRVDAPGAGSTAIKFENEIDYRRGR